MWHLSRFLCDSLLSKAHMSSRASLQHIPDFAIHSPIPKAGKEQSFPLLLLWDTLQMHTAGLTARASSGRGLLSIVSWAPRSSPLYDKCGKLRTLTVPSQFTLVCFTFFFFFNVRSWIVTLIFPFMFHWLQIPNLLEMMLYIGSGRDTILSKPNKRGNHFKIVVP